MKVAIVNHSDINGGAARAAWRIHHALRCQHIDSSMYVNSALSGDWTVMADKSKKYKVISQLRQNAGWLFNNLLKTKNPSQHSVAILPSTWPTQLNNSDNDIINLHWINFEMLSVADIPKISKPVIWTLHDMWSFCGAEHYTEDFRWAHGYYSDNRPHYESLFDLNRWTWKRKLKLWKHPIPIVTPSHWLGTCVRQSKLMHDWPVTVIPNAIDTDVWSPIDKRLARELMGIPLNVPVLAFGAMGGGQDPRKGMDLLVSALEHLRGQFPDLQLLVFGQHAPKEIPNLGFPIHYTGHLYDDLSLRILYSAVDAMMIPSRQDNLPNTGVEAMACGTPVIAFETCGLPDIVTHKRSGWLAKAFDTEDLAKGIIWSLSDTSRHMQLSFHARTDAVERFSYPIIAGLYEKAYKDIL